jgi:hypothetical protein
MPPSGPVAGFMELTQGQREKIQRLIEEELRNAVRAALKHDDAAAVAELLADRRRALEESVLEPLHYGENLLDQGGPGGGVAEQR